MRRIRQSRNNVWLYLQKDKQIHLCLFAALIVGIVASGVYVFLLPQKVCEELGLYIQDFFKNIGQSGTDSSELLKAAFFQNGRNTVLLLFCSLMMIGVPLVMVFTAVCSFAHGFTLIFLIRMYNWKAFLFLILGMCPHYLLLIPTYWLLCVVSIRFSLDVYHGKQERFKGLLPFLGKLAGLFCLTMVAALLQAYVEPLLIGMIAQLYI